jgi:hypothetical protein
MEQVVNITIDKHHALPFKILGRFVDALLIILLLAATFLAITLIPGHAQGIEEVVLKYIKKVPNLYLVTNITQVM